MNAQFQVAQATGTGNSNNPTPARVFKLSKPFADQAVVINLGYDQKVQVDFSAIANDKITLVHVGEKLIILFDNQSTVTIEPFFDSRHDQLGNLTIEVAPGRDLSVSEFASSFPIQTDASVLPAAGNGNGNAQASGANFSSPSVDPLATPPGLPLLGPETLPNSPVLLPTGFTLFQPPTPTTPVAGPTVTVGSVPDLVVDESFLTVATNGVAGSGQGPLGVTVASGLIPVSFTAPGGEQSLTFALSISSQGVDSGLIDSQTGNHVFLFVENGQVVGREGANAGAAAGSLKDFTIAVDGAGNVTLTDLRSVHENTPGDFNEGIQLGSGLVTLTATVTDNSNNTASASADVGPHLTILDDGPVITSVTSGLATFNVDESAIPVIGSGQAPLGTQTDTHSFSGDFNVTAGADGEQSLAYALTITHATTNLVDSITGQTVTLVQNGSNEVDGVVTISGQQVDVFKLTVDFLRRREGGDRPRCG